jgi:hypothetical protein
LVQSPLIGKGRCDCPYALPIHRPPPVDSGLPLHCRPSAPPSRTISYVVAGTGSGHPAIRSSTSSRRRPSSCRRFTVHDEISQLGRRSLLSQACPPPPDPTSHAPMAVGFGPHVTRSVSHASARRVPFPSRVLCPHRDRHLRYRELIVVALTLFVVKASPLGCTTAPGRYLVLPF